MQEEMIEILDDETEEAFITAAEHLGADLVAFVIQELKAMPKVWQMLGELEQQEIIDRAEARIESAVSKAVNNGPHNPTNDRQLHRSAHTLD